jgi:diguanylate cyclase (GGDEF)-like protein
MLREEAYVTAAKIRIHSQMDAPSKNDGIPRLSTEDHLRVCGEQARAVYDALPLSLFVNVTAGTVLAIALRDVVAHATLAGWMVMLVTVQLLRLCSLKAFRALHQKSANNQRWMRLAVAGAAGSGVAWGLASLFLWPDGDLVRQSIVMIVAAGMVAGGITTLSPILAAAISFLYCALLPLIWRLAVLDTAGAGYLLLMAVVFLVMMTVTARRSNHLLLASLVTQIGKERAEERVRYQATYDELTSLPNRRYLVNHLERELSRAQRHHWFGALFFLDIDHFKNVNDTLGHGAGDQLLRRLADRISARLRVEDTASRLGGDEFVLVFPDLTQDKDRALLEVDRLARQIMEVITSPFTINGHEVQVTASIGVALIPADGNTPDELLKHADTALYRAKEKGRNGYQVFMPDMQKAIQLRLTMERELRYGIANDQMRLDYQPQVDASGHVLSLEALVRWEHPRRGLILPNEFIGIAEQTGLVVALSRWVVMQAFQDLMSIRQAFPAASAPSMAVNISANDFRQDSLLPMLRELSRSPGFQRGDFRLELTEHTLMENYDGVIGIMRHAKTLGFSFAIDDFGTGHSSLAALKRLPVDVLKIDSSFVKDILNDSNDAVIVQTIIGMAENLELDTIAEGVETEKAYEALKRLGCRYFQGWYFGSAEPLAGILRRLKQEPATGRDADAGIPVRSASTVSGSGH